MQLQLLAIIAALASTTYALPSVKQVVSPLHPVRRAIDRECALALSDAAKKQPECAKLNHEKDGWNQDGPCIQALIKKAEAGQIGQCLYLSRRAHPMPGHGHQEGHWDQGPGQQGKWMGRDRSHSRDWWKQCEPYWKERGGQPAPGEPQWVHATQGPDSRFPGCPPHPPSHVHPLAGSEFAPSPSPTPSPSATATPTPTSSSATVGATPSPSPSDHMMYPL